MLRAKLYVNTVKRCADSTGKVVQEEINMSAVYGNDGSANAQWSKWTPSAQFSMTISNPDAFEKLLPGMFVYVDITPTTKE